MSTLNIQQRRLYILIFAIMKKEETDFADGGEPISDHEEEGKALSIYIVCRESIRNKQG